MTKIFPHCTISVGLAPLADYCISIFVRGGARARNVIVGRLWPKADDFSATIRPNG